MEYINDRLATLFLVKNIRQMTITEIESIHANIVAIPRPELIEKLRTDEQKRFTIFGTGDDSTTVIRNMSMEDEKILTEIPRWRDSVAGYLDGVHGGPVALSELGTQIKKPASILRLKDILVYDPYERFQVDGEGNSMHVTRIYSPEEVNRFTEQWKLSILAFLLEKNNRAFTLSEIGLYVPKPSQLPKNMKLLETLQSDNSGRFEITKVGNDFLVRKVLSADERFQLQSNNIHQVEKLCEEWRMKVVKYLLQKDNDMVLMSEIGLCVPRPPRLPREIRITNVLTEDPKNRFLFYGTGSSCRLCLRIMDTGSSQRQPNSMTYSQIQSDYSRYGLSQDVSPVSDQDFSPTAGYTKFTYGPSKNKIPENFPYPSLNFNVKFPSSNQTSQYPPNIPRQQADYRQMYPQSSSSTPRSSSPSTSGSIEDFDFRRRSASQDAVSSLDAPLPSHTARNLGPTGVRTPSADFFSHHSSTSSNQNIISLVNNQSHVKGPTLASKTLSAGALWQSHQQQQQQQQQLNIQTQRSLPQQTRRPNYMSQQGPGQGQSTGGMFVSPYDLRSERDDPAVYMKPRIVSPEDSHFHMQRSVQRERMEGSSPYSMISQPGQQQQQLYNKCTSAAKGRDMSVFMMPPSKQPSPMTAASAFDPSLHRRSASETGFAAENFPFLNSGHKAPMDLATSSWMPSSASASPQSPATTSTESSPVPSMFGKSQSQDRVDSLRSPPGLGRTERPPAQSVPPAFLSSLGSNAGTGYLDYDMDSSLLADTSKQGSLQNLSTAFDQYLSLSENKETRGHNQSLFTEGSSSSLFTSEPAASLQRPLRQGQTYGSSQGLGSGFGVALPNKTGSDSSSAYNIRNASDSPPPLPVPPPAGSALAQPVTVSSKLTDPNNYFQDYMDGVSFHDDSHDASL